MEFNKWLDTLVNEKGYDVETIIEVEGKGGLNIMSLEVVLNAIKNTCQEEKESIKNTLVIIDFTNRDCMHFFKYLAKALAI